VKGGLVVRSRLNDVSDKIAHLSICASPVVGLSRVVDIEKSIISTSRKFNTSNKNKVMIVGNVGDDGRIRFTNILNHLINRGFLLLTKEYNIVREKALRGIKNKIVAEITITPISIMFLEPRVKCLRINRSATRHLKSLARKCHGNTAHCTSSSTNSVMVRTCSIHEDVCPEGITLLVERVFVRNHDLCCKSNRGQKENKCKTH